ncbi:MAG: tetratricopeptide repeat protein, partial [Planctomycetes bacterium]|nr:tetratricopeptide repeat protein [Planctomycetota bacterium]
EAVQILRQDLERNPKAMATIAMLGHASLQLRQYSEAKQYFLQAIEIGPDYTNAYDGLVKACSNLGEEELAKEYAEKLRQAKARDYAAHRKWLKSYDDKRNVRTTMGDIYAAAANVYLLHNDPKTAETYLVKAIGLARGNIAAREVLAWLYQRQGRYEDAARTLTELLNYAPNSLSAQTSSAELWVKLRKYDEAEQAYRKAIELTPNHAGGYAVLARFLLQYNRKLPEAQELARKALELEPLPRHQLLYQAACEQVAAAERSR